MPCRKREEWTDGSLAQRAKEPFVIGYTFRMKIKSLAALLILAESFANQFYLIGTWCSV